MKVGFTDGEMVKHDETHEPDAANRSVPSTGLRGRDRRRPGDSTALVALLKECSGQVDFRGTFCKSLEEKC